MSAAHEIANLVYRYAEYVGAGDIDAVADLFAHAELSGSGQPEPAVGRAAVAALYTETFRRLAAAATGKLHAVTTNLQLDVDERAGTATGRSYFTLMRSGPAGRVQPVLAGRYADSFARVDGAWRFSRRHVIVDLVNDQAGPGYAELVEP
jgi:ketosteroid isomerase-like protein